MIPAGWTEKKLGVVCSIYTGNSINKQAKQRKYTNLPSGYSYIATKDIDYTSEVNYDNGVKIPFSETGFKLAPKSSTLLCLEGGSAGRKIAFTTQEVCFVNKLCAFVPNIDVLDAKFVFYFLQTPLFKRVFANKVAGLIGGVSTSKLKNLSIAYPSLKEQKKLVMQLDTLFADIDKEKQIVEQNLQNSNKLFESFSDKFFETNYEDWLCTTLGKISKQKQQKKEISLGDDSMVTFAPMEMLGIGIKYLNSKLVRRLGDVKSDYTYFAENDILMAKITPCFENGKIGIAQNLVNGIGFGSSEYIVFRTNENIDRGFLYYFLNRQSFRRKGAKRMLGAAGHKRVAKDFIDYYPFRYPASRCTQRNIVKLLDVIQGYRHQLEQIYTQQLADLDELKQSILKKAFNGEF